MKTDIPLLLLGIVSVCGCATNEPSVNYDIVPGEGIAHIAALGMHAQDVAKNTGNGVVATITGESGLWATVPSLGIFWHDEDTRDGITRLTFILDASAYDNSCPLSRLHRFRGTLSGVVSLSKPGSLTRDKVVAIFGEPAHAFDISAPTTNDVIRVLATHDATVRKCESASLLTATDIEVLSYPCQGIWFYLRNNIVLTLEVTKRVEPGALRR